MRVGSPLLPGWITDKDGNPLRKKRQSMIGSNTISCP